MIRRRETRSRGGLRADTTWVLTHWPDAETVIGGPYQSYNYALQQAGHLVHHDSEFIWRDHARGGQPEELELVGGGDATR